ncbi:MAG TPA: hypothetical protein VH643_33585 [Gemmataceae bacterium]
MNGSFPDGPPHGGEMVDPIPDDVKQFVEANIDSVDQLEILRVLGEDPAKEWSAATLVQQVQTQAHSIEAHLAALQTRGLLVTMPRGTNLFCRYGPRTPELEDMVDRLLQVYRERPVTMINFVYAKARQALKSFSDAFRLKKES